MKFINLYTIFFVWFIVMVLVRMWLNQRWKQLTSKYSDAISNVSQSQQTTHPIGFIIIRHIRDLSTNRYWLKSYNSIRKVYPKIPIVIIDDDSDTRFIDLDKENQLINCQVLYSEFPKRGELLAYYYYLRYHWFEKAIIIHDSVFIREPMDFESVQNVKFLWHFENIQYDDYAMETQLLTFVGGPYENMYHAKKQYWKGCFGLMSVIEYDFLRKLSLIFVLMDKIKTRRHRSCLERIFAVMCFYHYPALMRNPSFLGDIQAEYPQQWGYTFDNYELDEKKKDYKLFQPLVKVWTGR